MRDEGGARGEPTRCRPVVPAGKADGHVSLEMRRADDPASAADRGALARAKRLADGLSRTPYLEALGHEAAEDVDIRHSHVPPVLATVEERDQRGYAADPETGRRLRIRFGVELQHENMASPGCRKVLQCWRHGPAWSAPVGVKVYDDRDTRPLDRLGEIAISHGLGVVQAEWRLALGAFRALVQA